MSFLTGKDVLDVVALAEEKGVTRDGTLTVLSTAISLVAMQSGMSRKMLMKGVEAAYQQARRVAPNTAARSDAMNN